MAEVHAGVRVWRDLNQRFRGVTGPELGVFEVCDGAWTSWCLRVGRSGVGAPLEGRRRLLLCLCSEVFFWQTCSSWWIDLLKHRNKLNNKHLFCDAFSFDKAIFDVPWILITRWFIVFFFFLLQSYLRSASVYRRLEKRHQIITAGRIAVMNWLNKMLPKKKKNLPNFLVCKIFEEHTV